MDLCTNSESLMNSITIPLPCCSFSVDIACTIRLQALRTKMVQHIQQWKKEKVQQVSQWYGIVAYAYSMHFSATHKRCKHRGRSLLIFPSMIFVKIQ